MKLRGPVAALLVASLVACGGGGTADDPAPEAGTAEEQVAQPAAVPVTLDADEGAAAGGTLGPAGGTVAATGADGTRYELVVPAGAVAADVAVTVTPLRGVDGLPDGATLRHGADFAPDGLELLQPGWLVITPSTPVDDVAAGFEVHDGMARPDVVGADGGRFVVPVVRFSGAGTLGGPGPGRGGFGWPDLPPAPQTGGGYGSGPIDIPTGFPGPMAGGRTPPGPGGGATGEQTSGGGPRYGPSLTEGLDAGAATGGDDGGLDEAVRDKARAQLEGDEEAEADADRRIDAEAKKREGEAWDLAEQCIREKDVSVLRRLVALVSEVQLLGRGDTAGELIEACGRFSLDVYGEAGFDMGGVFVINDSIELSIPLALDGAWSGSGTADLQTEGYDRGMELLEVLGWGLGQAMGIAVPENDITRNAVSCGVTPPTGQVDALATGILGAGGPRVRLGLATLKEATVSCPQPVGSFPMPPMSLDLGLLGDIGFPGLVDGGIELADFTMTGKASPFATREEHKEVSSEGVTLVVGWHLDLHHAPAELPEGDPRAGDSD